MQYVPNCPSVSLMVWASIPDSGDFVSRVLSYPFVSFATCQRIVSKLAKLT